MRDLISIQLQSSLNVQTFNFNIHLCIPASDYRQLIRLQMSSAPSHSEFSVKRETKKKSNISIIAEKTLFKVIKNMSFVGLKHL